MPALPAGAVVVACSRWGCSGCAGSPAQPSTLRLGEPFELRLGARATLDGDTVLTFADVPSDSRCPMDALCVWEGEAVVSVMFGQRGPVRRRQCSRFNAYRSTEFLVDEDGIPLPSAVVHRRADPNQLPAQHIGRQVGGESRCLHDPADSAHAGSSCRQHRSPGPTT